MSKTHRIQIPISSEHLSLSLSLSYLVHIRVTPPLCKSLQLLSSTLKDLKHVLFFFSFFLCINQVQTLSREKCAKVIDPECTEEVHFRVPTLWPMCRHVTVYKNSDTVYKYWMWRMNNIYGGVWAGIGRIGGVHFEELCVKSSWDPTIGMVA